MADQKPNRRHISDRGAPLVPNSRGIRSRKGFKVTKLHEAKNTKPIRGGGASGSDRKPPSGGGKLCVQIAPFAAIPALLTLGNAITQSIL